MQYTIRNIGPALDKALRAKAQKTHKSLNEVAVEALENGAGLGLTPEKFTDLDYLFGSWVEDKKMDEALAAQRQVDEELWK